MHIHVFQALQLASRVGSLCPGVAFCTATHWQTGMPEKEKEKAKWVWLCLLMDQSSHVSCPDGEDSLDLLVTQVHSRQPGIVLKFRIIIMCHSDGCSDKIMKYLPR